MKHFPCEPQWTSTQTHRHTDTLRRLVREGWSIDSHSSFAIISIRLFLIILRVCWRARDGTILCERKTERGEEEWKSRQQKASNTRRFGFCEFILFLIFGSDCRTMSTLVFIRESLWTQQCKKPASKAFCSRRDVSVWKKDKKGVKISNLEKKEDARRKARENFPASTPGRKSDIFI